mgnify:CR=1 FL=1
MSINVGEVLLNLWQKSGFNAIFVGFADGGWQNLVMLIIACVLLYLGIVKKFEPLLLVGKKLTPVQLTGVKMQEYFETLLAQMERSTVDSMVTMGLALHEMLALCAQNILAQAEATSTRQVILQAVETIRKHYQQELCLADLLAEAHMSKSYFLRLFRRYMGTTPYNYLVNFRITQAKELLVLTDHSVGEIAQKVGFGDASNFSTRFAKATGQSPLQYRKRALKPQEGTR